MAQNSKGKWADIQRGHHNPLAFAVTSRDSGTLSMVEDAIRHKQVRLAFQSVMDSQDHARPAFYEGLIRVLDDTGRIIPAGEFMGAVENTETGREIDTLALDIGLRTLAANPSLRLSINMSARSIGYGRWMSTLKRGLRKNATIGERLILEITESSALLVPELVSDFMAELQADGIAFALDNFGSGLTSLRYLKEFYFDILKIDGYYAKGIAADRDNQVLTSAIVGIAREFEMYTVAQNVEAAEDAGVLSALGVDCLQGYLFGAPSMAPPWKKTGKSSSAA